MDKLEGLLLHWRSLKLSEILAVIWIVLMVIFTISISLLFDNFIDSKPAGRKTVMGKYCMLVSVGKMSKFNSPVNKYAVSIDLCLTG